MIRPHITDYIASASALYCTIRQTINKLTSDINTPPSTILKLLKIRNNACFWSVITIKFLNTPLSRLVCWIAIRQIHHYYRQLYAIDNTLKSQPKPTSSNHRVINILEHEESITQNFNNTQLHIINQFPRYKKGLINFYNPYKPRNYNKDNKLL